MIALPFDTLSAIQGIDGTLFAYGDGSYEAMSASDPAAVDTSRGYWFFSPAAATVHLDGTRVTPGKVYSIALRQGWNLVGVPGHVRLSFAGMSFASTAGIRSVGSAVSSEPGQDGASLYRFGFMYRDGTYETVDLGAPAAQTTVGAAYWIHAWTAGILSFANPKAGDDTAVLSGTMAAGDQVSSDVDVVVASLGSGSRYFGATDSSGAFRFDAVEPGETRIQVLDSADGSILASARVRLTQSTGMDLPLLASQNELQSDIGRKDAVTASDAPLTFPLREPGRWPANVRSAHAGGKHSVDFSLPGDEDRGEEVLAAHGGSAAYYPDNGKGGYGNWVEVTDPVSGYSTRYAHLEAFASNRPAQVAAGDLLGYVGTTGFSTGYHLHFELRQAGVMHAVYPQSARDGDFDLTFPATSQGVFSAAPANGRLRIRLQPPEVSAEINVKSTGQDWTRWNTGGSSVVEREVAPGEYEVGTSSVPGWSKPANQTVTVGAGSTTEVSLTFVREQAQLSAAWDGQSPNPAMGPGGSARFAVAFRNTGTQTWHRDGNGLRVHLGTWLPQDRVPGFVREDLVGGSPSGWVSGNRIRMSEASVGPGQTAHFEFWMSVPGDKPAGSYREAFRLVADGPGGGWFGPEGVHWDITVEAGASFGAELVSLSPDPGLTPGGSASFEARFENVGRATWKREGTVRVHLGTWDPQDRAPGFVREDLVGGNTSGWISENRVGMVEREVPPGGIGTFRFWMSPSASQAAGAYEESFRPVADGPGGAWFGPQATWRVTFTAASAGYEDQYLVGDWTADGQFGRSNIAVRRNCEVLMDDDFDTRHDRAETYGCGVHNDQYLAGDWDGNGESDLAVRRGGVIHMDTGRTFAFGNGNLEDAYLVGDYNGDRKDEIWIRRGCQFLVDTAQDGGSEEASFPYGCGVGNDQYLVGNWDGQGGDDVAVRRGGLVIYSNRPEQAFGMGNAEDEYLVGDWDGDGRDNIAVRRGARILMDFDFDGAHNLEQVYGEGTEPEVSERAQRSSGLPLLRWALRSLLPKVLPLEFARAARAPLLN